MIILKLVEPYQISLDEYRIHISLEHQYFSVHIGNKKYQFVPYDSKEIIIHRKTQKIVNTEASFAFQYENEILNIAMLELMYHPDFLIQLHHIAGPYFLEDASEYGILGNELELIIEEFEHDNIKRLIDKALDNRDEKQFYALLKLL